MSQYRDGDVTVTNGSATVTGSGTLWSTNLEAGDLFIRQGDNVTYTIASVDDDTTLQLTAPYAGVTGSGVSYVGHRDFTPEGFPLMQDGDVETVVIYNYAVTLMSGYGSAATEGNAGVVRLATQAEAEAGTNDTRVMTPLKTTQHLTERTQSSPIDTTADALMPVGAFGLGANSGQITAPDYEVLLSIDYNRITQVFHPDLNGTRSVLSLRTGNTTSGLDFAARATNGDISVRSILSGVGEDWIDLYSTGNLNTNEFGGLPSTVIGVGIARSATSIYVMLPTQSFGAANSISVISTFKVLDAAVVDIATGLDVNDIAISSLRNGKVSAILVNNLTGLNIGDSYYLIGEGANSKITVNF